MGYENSHFATGIIQGTPTVIVKMDAEKWVNEFHLNMIIQNPQLSLLPCQRYFYQGEEVFIFSIMYLKSVEEVLRAGDISLKEVVSQISEILKESIQYQLEETQFTLNPEYVYYNTKEKRVVLLYVPQKNKVEDNPAEALVKLIEGYCEIPVVLQGLSKENLHGLYKCLRSSKGNLRTLIEALALLGKGMENSPKLQSSARMIQEAAVQEEDEPVRIPTSVGTNSNRQKEKFKKHLAVKEKRLIPEIRSKEKSKTKDGGEKARFIPITVLSGVVSLIMGLIIFLWPLAQETKIGLWLIGTAILFLLVYKQYEKIETLIGLNRKRTPKPVKNKVETMSKNVTTEETICNETGEVTYWKEEVKQHLRESDSNARCPSAFESAYTPQKIQEETVLINSEMARRTLLIRRTNGAQYLPLQRAVHTIGRNAGVCDIFIDEPSVGRLHAEVHLTNQRVYVRDLNSANGTFINGQRIAPNQYSAFEVGDKLTVGRQEMILT